MLTHPVLPTYTCFSPTKRNHCKNNPHSLWSLLENEGHNNNKKNCCINVNTVKILGRQHDGIKIFQKKLYTFTSAHKRWEIWPTSCANCKKALSAKNHIRFNLFLALLQQRWKMSRRKKSIHTHPVIVIVHYLTLNYRNNSVLLQPPCYTWGTFVIQSLTRNFLLVIKNHINSQTLIKDFFSQTL